jgi:hypothetical protein
MLCVNKKDICLSIAKALNELKCELTGIDPEGVKEHSERLVARLLDIIYNERLRFGQYR